MLIHKNTIMLIISKCALYLMSCNIRNMSEASLTKRSKADKLKKLMRELKSVYGELVETNVQRKRRLKLERTGSVLQQSPNTKDTELFWAMQNSRKNLKRIKSAKSQDQFVGENQIVRNKVNISSEKSEVSHEIGDEISNSTYKLSGMTRNINNNHDKTISTTETSCLNENVSEEDSNIHNNVSLSNSNISHVEGTNAKYDVHSNRGRLPDIIIKNLPSFPIMSNKRESITQSTQVLSISVLDDRKTMKFPSVTKILTCTMPLESKLALEAWKERMIEKLGHDGFETHQKALLEDGASLHSCIAQNLRGEEFEVPPRIEPVFKSVQSALKDIEHVKAIETYVAHKKLHYKGIVDCVASYRGENYVIDWKKSDKKKLNLKQTYDGPTQVAAYIGAINASNIYPFVVKRGLLVIAYTCGTPATVHEICDNTLQHYWTEWLHRLQKYYVETANNDDNENTAIKH